MTPHEPGETIQDIAADGRMTEPMLQVARREGMDPEKLLRLIKRGRVVVMRRGGVSLGIGTGLRTKLNVNIGLSHNGGSIDDEVEKAVIAERFGADTLSDLSTCDNIPAIREAVFAKTTIPVTTVPVYQAAAEHGVRTFTDRDLLSVIREQARAGISSMVLHCITPEILGLADRQDRVLGIVSKGGAITCSYMRRNDRENPYLEHLDEILGIFREFDIVLSLGNSARSGCIHDREDRASREELKQNAAIARYAHAQGVQVIVEGCGGHTRLDRIPAFVRRYKKATPFPLFVAGPLPTDIALGYDHVAGCVGASSAAAAGADYLCCITASEHLGLPGPDQVKEGLIAFRIAAHIGDIVKLRQDGPDRELSEKRAELDREAQFPFAMDESRARMLAGNHTSCSMCGDLCAIRLMRDLPGPRRPDTETERP